MVNHLSCTFVLYSLYHIHGWVQVFVNHFVGACWHPW